MRYVSTRRQASQASLEGVTFEEALSTGYAPDGGLYVPTSLPQIDSDTLKHFASLSYLELSYEILRRFISEEEIPNKDLKQICTLCYGNWSDDTNSSDDDTEVVPVTNLGSVWVAELYHGPTQCFKDLGMKVVVNLLSYFSSRAQRRTTLLAATTGDTGPAATHAVSEANNPLLGILVHYPEGQISEFQRRQLTTVGSNQVRVVAFDGGGDDMDAPIKSILTESKKSADKRRRICGINSYNIGRPVAQMTHSVWTYLRVVEQLGVQAGEPDSKVNFVIPTGAMGNIAGAYMCKKTGIPLGVLCAGVNANDITHRVISSGEFHRSDSMVKTLSDAINIQVPYNFERLLYYLTDEDSNLVRKWMTTMDKTQKLDLDATWLCKLQQEFRSAKITDEEMCRTMKMVQDKFGFTADPHTSVALATSEKLGCGPFSSLKMTGASNKEVIGPVAIFATASPCKFQDSVTTALGKDGWDAYYQNGFPSRAKEVMNKTEMEVIRYKRKAGFDLATVQKEWEDMTRTIIETELS